MHQRRALIFPTLLVGPWCWKAQRLLLETRGYAVDGVEEPFVMVKAESTMDGVEAVCAELLSRQDGPCLLIGNSLGGFVALRLAVRFPDLVTGCVVSGAPGLGPMPNLGIGTKAMMSPLYAKMVRDRIFADPTRVSDDVVRSALDSIAEPRAAKAGVRLLRSLREIDIQATLDQITVPTALIWGAEDRVSPPNLWRTAARSNLQLHFFSIPGSGHSPMYETPDAFNAILDRFLSDID
jgi:pimeloyl-ACP methyl ester carboxylesterase